MHSRWSTGNQMSNPYVSSTAPTRGAQFVTYEEDTSPEKDADYGLHILVEPQQRDSLVDIVAVHGIGADPSQMWAWKPNIVRNGKKTGVNNINWLTHAEMLPKLAPNARIMRYGYKSQWFGTENVETKKTFVYEVAIALLTAIAELRKDEEPRPLIFIAHSFGGLVLIRAIRLAFDNSTSKYTLFGPNPNPAMAALFMSTAGLVFFGTPFRGRGSSDLEAWTERLLDCHRVKYQDSDEAVPPFKVRSETMSTSVPGNPYLQDMVRQFGETRIGDHPIPLWCFYENEESPVGKMLGDSNWGDEYIAPYETACLDVSKNTSSIGLPRHHYNLPKFPGTEDEAWKIVASKIRSLVSGAKDFLEECSKDQEYSVEFNKLSLPTTARFTGRDKELDDIRRKLQEPRGRGMVILHGLGGIGKTQLAAHYAERHKTDYSAVFWLNSQDKASVRRDYAQTACRILRQHPFAGSELKSAVLDKSDDGIIRLVQQWLDLTKNKCWLLVFDNYDTPQDFNIQEYFPSADQGAIIVTTTVSNLSLGSWPQIKIDKLDIEESLQILADVSGRRGICQDADAIRLAKELDGLPLALASAGTFLKNTTWSLSKYLELWINSWSQLQEDSPRVPLYDRILYSTWQLSLENIKKNDPSVKLLHLWAFFDREDLWFELLREGRAEAPEWFRTLTEDELSFTRAVRVLLDHGIVDKGSKSNDTEESGGYSMHSCVHSWTLHVLNRSWNSEMFALAEVCITSYQLRHDLTKEFARLERDPGRIDGDSEYQTRWERREKQLDLVELQAGWNSWRATPHLIRQLDVIIYHDMTPSIRSWVHDRVERSKRLIWTQFLHRDTLNLSERNEDIMKKVLTAAALYKLKPALN